MKVFFKLFENGRLPQRQTEGSVGFDLFSSEEVVILSGKTVRINCGFAMEMPDGIGAQIFSRSGLAFKNSLFVMAGTIDSDFRGPVGVVLHNLSPEPFYIKIGNRIAQMIFFNCLSTSFEIVDELSMSSRNTNGLGSTGL